MGKQGSKTQRGPSKPQRLTKIATGVAGLDDILEGGFPAGRTTLISGGPGTGKTMLGLEFLYKSALAGHAGILLRFVEISNRISRSLLVLKSRGTKHSNSYHRFVITDNGIEITSMPSGARLSELQAQPSTAPSHAEAGVDQGGES